MLSTISTRTFRNIVHGGIGNAQKKDQSDNSCLVPPGDVCVFYDGGKSSIAEATNRTFVGEVRGKFGVLAKVARLAKKSIHVCLDEECLTRRCAVTRGFGSLRQLRTLHVYYNAATVILLKNGHISVGQIWATS